MPTLDVVLTSNTGPNRLLFPLAQGMGGRRILLNHKFSCYQNFERQAAWKKHEKRLLPIKNYESQTDALMMLMSKPDDLRSSRCTRVWSYLWCFFIHNFFFFCLFAFAFEMVINTGESIWLRTGFKVELSTGH